MKIWTMSIPQILMGYCTHNYLSLHFETVKTDTIIENIPLCIYIMETRFIDSCYFSWIKGKEQHLRAYEVNTRVRTVIHIFSMHIPSDNFRIQRQKQAVTKNLCYKNKGGSDAFEKATIRSLLGSNKLCVRLIAYWISLIKHNINIFIYRIWTKNT